MPIGCYYPVLSLIRDGTLLSKMPSSVSQMQHHGSSAPSQLNTSTALGLFGAYQRTMRPAPARAWLSRSRSPPLLSAAAALVRLLPALRRPRGRPLVTAAQRHGARPAQPTVSPDRLKAAVVLPLRLFPSGRPCCRAAPGKGANTPLPSRSLQPPSISSPPSSGLILIWGAAGSS